MLRLRRNFVNALPGARAPSEAIVAATPPGQILPSPLDRAFHRAVARAAMDHNVATREPALGYFEE